MRAEGGEAKKQEVREAYTHSRSLANSLELSLILCRLRSRRDYMLCLFYIYCDNLDGLDATQPLSISFEL
jgi:hypothetical protein